MPFRLKDIRLHIEEDVSQLKQKIAKQFGVGEEQILSFRILRESIDARKKQDIYFNYTLMVSLKDEKRHKNKVRDPKIEWEVEGAPETIPQGDEQLRGRPVIVGGGPAGLFAGLLLSSRGYRPLLIERGKPVKERKQDIKRLWTQGTLDTNSNIQFGEGGAGTFSDGKLTTRIKDPRCDTVLQWLVEAGAPEEITYVGKAHIGTDVLEEVIRNIRERIISQGGEFLFNSTVVDLDIRSAKMASVSLHHGETIPTNAVIMAVGHSSRDTYEMLLNKGIPMSAKPFAVGVRIEHSQAWLDEVQYGPYAGHPRLGAADYKLTYQDRETQRGVYTFCMCPGGVVVAAASEEGRLVTNGMSFHARNGKNANSAVVVTVGPEDFGSHHPLAGVEFQRRWEAKAFELGGGGYKAPAQRVEDFLKERPTGHWGQIEPTYQPGVVPQDLKHCLPEPVHQALKNGIVGFDHKIHGFATPDAILTGVETRTSAPIRIQRQDDLQVPGAEGLFAAGEGAGYAGGIVSAAVDGMKAAECLIRKFKPLD